MKRHLDTRLVHGPDDGHSEPSGAVVGPVHLSSTWRMGSDPDRPLRYQRLGNAPDQLELESRIADLCGGERALLFASGMAAISSTLLALLQAGDALLVSRSLYGGTQALLDRDLARFGVGHQAVDATRPDQWAAALTPTCKVFYVEALSNPLLEVPELEAVVAF